MLCPVCALTGSLTHVCSTVKYMRRAPFFTPSCHHTSLSLFCLLLEIYPPTGATRARDKWAKACRLAQDRNTPRGLQSHLPEASGTPEAGRDFGGHRFSPLDSQRRRSIPTPLPLWLYLVFLIITHFYRIVLPSK